MNLLGQESAAEVLWEIVVMFMVRSHFFFRILTGFASKFEPAFKRLFEMDLHHATLLSTLIDAVDVEFRDVDMPTHKKLCQV